MAANKNLTLKLFPRKDADGQIYYLSKLEAPVLIDCTEGATFLVFISDEGDEQLQIALSTKKDD